MPSSEDIADQQNLLATYRQTLVYYLDQQAKLTTTYAPPAVFHGIQESRDNIWRVKSILRGWGVEVEDHPDDEPPAVAFPKDQSLPSTNRSVRGQDPVDRGDEPRDRAMVPESPGEADVIADAPNPPSPATVEEYNHTDEAAPRTKQLGHLSTIQSIKKLFKHAHEILGAPAWQGIGVVVGILGLILTIVLSSQPPTSLPIIATPPIDATLTVHPFATIGAAASVAPAVPTPLATAPVSATPAPSTPAVPTELLVPSPSAGMVARPTASQAAPPPLRVALHAQENCVDVRAGVQAELPTGVTLVEPTSDQTQATVALEIELQCAGQQIVIVAHIPPQLAQPIEFLDEATVLSATTSLPYGQTFILSLIDYAHEDYGHAIGLLDEVKKYIDAPSMQLLRAQTFMHLEQWAEARAAYTAVLEARPEADAATRARAYAGRALAYILEVEKGNYEDKVARDECIAHALGDFDQAINAQHERVLWLVGRALARAKCAKRLDVPAMRADAEKAISLSRNDQPVEKAIALSMMASILLKYDIQQDTSQAFSLVQQARELAPQLPSPYQWLSCAYQKRQDEAHAKDKYREYIARLVFAWQREIADNNLGDGEFCL